VMFVTIGLAELKYRSFNPVQHLQTQFAVSTIALPA